jgi:hypothetical protein
MVNKLPADVEELCWRLPPVARAFFIDFFMILYFNQCFTGNDFVLGYLIF